MSIAVTKNANDVEVTPSSGITVGDDVEFAATGSKLKASLKFEIESSSGVEQELVIHASCSKPIAIGDQFGSMLLRFFFPEE